MITAYLFSRFYGITTYRCIILRRGLRAEAKGKSLDEAHALALDLLRTMEANR